VKQHENDRYAFSFHRCCIPVLALGPTLAFAFIAETRGLERAQAPRISPPAAEPQTLDIHRPSGYHLSLNNTDSIQPLKVERKLAYDFHDVMSQLVTSHTPVYRGLCEDGVAWCQSSWVLKLKSWHFCLPSSALKTNWAVYFMACMCWPPRQRGYHVALLNEHFLYADGEYR
jgi:hypothetical protein